MELIRTLGMSRDKWLEMRRSSIGGSDAAAIVGLNQYSSPYSVWADKLGLIPEKEDNEAMRQGRDLEDYVARRFMEQTGKKVRRVNAIIKNEQYPFAHANIDRDIVGEDAGLECKTTSTLNMSKFKNGEFPANYYVQCVHYLAVTGKKKWYLAVLIMNKDFLIYEIERDEEEINALMEAERAFWSDHVLTKSAPQVDGSEATSKAISAQYGEQVTSSNVMDLSTKAGAVKQIIELQAQIKALSETKDSLENQVKEYLGNAEVGECDGYKVVWDFRERKTFDRKSFEQANKLDLSPWYKTSTSRYFSIKERKA